MHALFMTDLHLLDPEGSAEAASRAAFVGECLERAAQANPGATFNILGGDLTNLGEPGAYRWLKTRLDALPFPTFPMLGNHDDREAFISVFGARDTSLGYVQSAHRLGQTHVILLDTLDPGSDAGVLCTERLAFLDRRLGVAGSDPVCLFMHHPPCNIGDAQLDRIKLSKASEFLSILQRHGNVRQIFFGHVHRNMHLVWNGISCVSIDALGDAASDPSRRHRPTVGLLREMGDGLAISLKTLET